MKHFTTSNILSLEATHSDVRSQRNRGNLRKVKVVLSPDSDLESGWPFSNREMAELQELSL